MPLLLTEEHWYFRQSGPRQGEARVPCKLCTSFIYAMQTDQDVPAGFIDCKHVLKFLQELVLRCGSIERASRYAGISTNTGYRVLRLGQCNLQRGTAAKIITALDEKRREDRRNGFVSKTFLEVRQHQARMEDRLNLLPE